MSDEPVGRKALRLAERESRADASRLVAAVPAMMREARRRRDAANAVSPTLAQLASGSLPRLAAVTVVAVIAATGVVAWERGRMTPAPASVESVILGGAGNGTGDVVFDALLQAGRRDG
jgi:hypothetical protein